MLLVQLKTSKLFVFVLSPLIHFIFPFHSLWEPFNTLFASSCYVSSLYFCVHIAKCTWIFITNTYRQATINKKRMSKTKKMKESQQQKSKTNEDKQRKNYVKSFAFDFKISFVVFIYCLALMFHFVLCFGAVLCHFKWMQSKQCFSILVLFCFFCIFYYYFIVSSHCYKQNS